jgi:hypothetical protein
VSQPSTSKAAHPPLATRSTRGLHGVCEAEMRLQRLLSRSLGRLHKKCDPPARPMRVIASDQPPFTSATRYRPRQTPALQPTVCCLAYLCLFKLVDNVPQLLR